MSGLQTTVRSVLGQPVELERGKRVVAYMIFPSLHLLAIRLVEDIGTVIC